MFLQEFDVRTVHLAPQDVELGVVGVLFGLEDVSHVFAVAAKLKVLDMIGIKRLRSAWHGVQRERSSQQSGWASRNHVPSNCLSQNGLSLIACGVLWAAISLLCSHRTARTIRGAIAAHARAGTMRDAIATGGNFRGGIKRDPRPGPL